MGVASGAGADRFNAAWWLVDRHLEEGRAANTAVLCQGRRLTYADLHRAVCAAANGLAGLGLRREERVAMVVNDEPAFPAVFLGAMRLGAVPVPLSTMLTASDLGAVVDDAGARLLVVSSDYVGHVARIAELAPGLTGVVVVGDAPLPEALPAWRLSELDDSSERPPAPTSGESPGFWLYTSGTTGLPKGAMHRHVDLRATAETYARTVLRIEEGDRCYSVAKLFFAYGLGNSLTFPFAVGASAVLAPGRPGPAAVAALLEEHRPTLFFSSPGFCAAMLDAPVPAGALSSVRLVATAGEALPAELHRRFTTTYGVPVLDGIGSTEALHIFLSNHEGAERPGTSGTPVEGYEMRLLDEAGAEVSEPDAPGFLHVRGESVATGYWCRSEATRAAFLGEWLRTGDVYTRSADGYWTFLGRNNDMMKVGGIWVSPAEVENVLLQHDDVLEAAVVGARDADGLETAVAFLVPRSGRSIDPATVESHCRARMAAFKRPRRVVVVDALPKTATGKVQRFALRQQLADR